MRGWLEVLKENEDVKELEKWLTLEQDYLLLSLGRFIDYGLPNEKQKMIDELHAISSKIVGCNTKREELRNEYESSKTMLSSKQ